VADQATLDQVAADYVRQKGDDREAIRRVLEIQEVREIAAGAGFDLKRAETAVATLDDAEVGLIAAQARAVNDSLAGGGSITISTTVIIIGLLVLILLIVAI
jgi:acetyl-CoA carboxylase carboxyltransferase component